MREEIAIAILVLLALNAIAIALAYVAQIRTRAHLEAARRSLDELAARLRVMQISLPELAGRGRTGYELAVGAGYVCQRPRPGVCVFPQCQCPPLASLGK